MDISHQQTIAMSEPTAADIQLEILRNSEFSDHHSPPLLELEEGLEAIPWTRPEPSPGKLPVYAIVT